MGRVHITIPPYFCQLSKSSSTHLSLFDNLGIVEPSYIARIPNIIFSMVGFIIHYPIRSYKRIMRKPLSRSKHQSAYVAWVWWSAWTIYIYVQNYIYHILVVPSIPTLIQNSQSVLFSSNRYICTVIPQNHPVQIWIQYMHSKYVNCLSVCVSHDLQVKFAKANKYIK